MKQSYEGENLYTLKKIQRKIATSCTMHVPGQTMCNHLVVFCVLIWTILWSLLCGVVAPTWHETGVAKKCHVQLPDAKIYAAGDFSHHILGPEYWTGATLQQKKWRKMKWCLQCWSGKSDVFVIKTFGVEPFFEYSGCRNKEPVFHWTRLLGIR